MKRAVFLDRDGTLNTDTRYAHRVDTLEVVAGAPEALRALQGLGFELIVVTNQSGLARGLFDETAMAAFHDELARRFAVSGVTFAGWYWCPHHPEASIEALRKRCACRKPAPGMLLAAARDHGIDLASSYMVGDQERDAAAADAAGCTPLTLGGSVSWADVRRKIESLEMGSRRMTGATPNGDSPP